MYYDKYLKYRNRCNENNNSRGGDDNTSPYGKNIPPEIDKQIYLNLLKVWNTITVQYKIEYVMWYGTLLGWKRNQSVIPYDYDIDVIISRDSLKKLLKIANPTCNYRTTPEIIPSSKMRLVYNSDYNKKLNNRSRWSLDGKLVDKQIDPCSFDGPIARLIYNGSHYLDIYGYYYYPESTSEVSHWITHHQLDDSPGKPYYSYGKTDLSLNFDFKVIPCQLDGVETYRPDNDKMEDLLVKMYGNEYMIPDHIYHYQDQKWYKRYMYFNHTKFLVDDTHIQMIRKELTTLLTEWIKLAHDHDIRWQITAGTLLGSYRDDDIMPWDDDIDLRIHPDDWDLVQRIYRSGSQLGPISLKDNPTYQPESKVIKGYPSLVFTPPNKWKDRTDVWYAVYLRHQVNKSQDYIHDLLHIDLVKASDKDIIISKKGWGWDAHPWTPSQQYSLLGLRVPGPSVPESYLENSYGESFRQYPYCSVKGVGGDTVWLERWNENPKRGDYSCQPLFSFSPPHFTSETQIYGIETGPRKVASLTSIPSRLKYIEPTLQSLVAQDVLDVVYLNLPYYSIKQRKIYQVPDFVKKYPKIKVIRSPDYGPLTKLIPTLFVETHPNTRIITCDDDIIYGKGLATALLDNIEEKSQVCLTKFNWSKLKKTQEYAPENLNGVEENVPQAFSGICYWRSSFNIEELMDLLKQLPLCCIYGDDYLLAKYLSKKGVKVKVLDKNLYPYYDYTSHYPSNIKSNLHKAALSNLGSGTGGNNMNYINCEKYDNIFQSI